MHFDFEDPTSHVAAQVERWLTDSLCLGRAGEPTPLPARSLEELLDAVRGVLSVRPALAQAARQLPAYDQFRLTLEIARAAMPNAAATRPVMGHLRVPTTRSAASCRARGVPRRRSGH